MKKNDLKNGMWILIIVGVISLVFLVYIYYTSTSDSIEVSKLRFEIIKVILVSVVLSILAIFIPNWFADKRHELNIKLEEKKHASNLKLATEEFNLERNKQDFETQREGRKLYSKLKTGKNYLPQRMAAMSYDKAMEHLESLHQAYHLVVLYPDSEYKKIGNYRNYFEKYKLYELREALSILMCEENYKISNIQERVKMIDEKCKEVSK